MKSLPRYRRLTAAVLCASLIMPPTSHAVTPDNHAPVSAFWTAAKILKEWFDWRSATGWGTIGLTNVILTAATGESGGSITRAVFQTVCGTAAAGVMATIKVPTEPTTTNHIATIVKGASVVGPSVLCGWVSRWIYDSVLPPISTSITLKNINIQYDDKAALAQINALGVTINNLMLKMEVDYRQAAVFKSNADYFANNLRINNCRLKIAGTTPFCKKNYADYYEAMGQAQQHVDALNASGRSMKAAQTTLNNIYWN